MTASKNAHILIVDDSLSNIELLLSMLESEYEISVATSASQALKLLNRQSLIHALPDLILLDVLMPLISGYELCRQLRQMEGEIADLPIIFVTALSDTNSEVQALEIGGVDFISKPLQPTLVKARIKLHICLAQQQRELQLLSQQLSKNLKKLDQFQQREQLTNASIQQELLFGDIPKVVAGHKIASWRAPLQVVDGDFYAFSHLTEDVFELITGDVMGKGISAAMVGAGVKNAYLESYSRILLRERSAPLPSVASVVNEMHALLIDRLMGLGLFVTLTILRFDRRNRCLTQVNAGHPPTLVVGSQNGLVRELLGPNLPLGILENEIYQEESAELNSGDLVCVYSDGLLDAQNSVGDLFGLDRVRQSLIMANKLHPEVDAVVDQVRSDLIGFTQTTMLTDDTSLIAIRTP